jgi:hypothetical protein
VTPGEPVPPTMPVRGNPKGTHYDDTLAKPPKP